MVGEIFINLKIFILYFDKNIKTFFFLIYIKGSFAAPGCTQFYQCFNTNTPQAGRVLQTCPAGTLFDNNQKNCNTASLVNCGAQAPSTASGQGFISAGSLSVSNSIPSQIRVDAGSVAGNIEMGGPFVCPSDGFFAIKPTCRTYYHCAHSNTPYAMKVLYTCPNQLVFDNAAQNCNFPSQTKC